MVLLGFSSLKRYVARKGSFLTGSVGEADSVACFHCSPLNPGNEVEVLEAYYGGCLLPAGEQGDRFHQPGVDLVFNERRLEACGADEAEREVGRPAIDTSLKNSTHSEASNTARFAHAP
jgi:hypothetical protein